MVVESWKNLEYWFEINVMVIICLYEVLCQCDFLDKYVYIIIFEVYGSIDGFIKEDMLFNLSIFYVVFCVVVDMSLKIYFDVYGFLVVFIWVVNVYGLGQQLYCIILCIIFLVLIGKKLQLYGGGFLCCFFIYMCDVLSVIYVIVMCGINGQIYYIFIDEIVSVCELVECICVKLDVDFVVNVEIVGECLGKDVVYMLNSSKLCQSLDWNVKVLFDEGLDECVSWVWQNLDVMQVMEWNYVYKF